MTRVHHKQDFSKPEQQAAVAGIKQALHDAFVEGSFAEREVQALALTNEAVRQLLEEALQAIADKLGEAICVDGVVYSVYTPRPGTVVYHSLCGGLAVTRHVYKQDGVRNGPTVDPVALTAGLVEGATPALGYSVVLGYAEQDMRQHGRTLQAAHRVPPSRSTLERLATDIASEAHVAAPRIDAQLRRGEPVPDGTVAVSVGLDRSSAPMAELRPPTAPPKPEPKRSKPRQRRAPEPFDVVYRMAYVGTVSFVDEQGVALATRRYALPACDDPEPLAARMQKDVRSALRRHPELNVGIVQDGAPEMWNVMRRALQPLVDDGLITEWREGIDRYHLLERLGKATQIAEPNDVVRAQVFGGLIELFDSADSTIDSIEYQLYERYAGLTDAQQEALDEHLTYIANNKDRMRYVTLRRAGLPVGSGVTESAAKTVIGQRATRSGQRWSEHGLRGVLAVRGVLLSDRLPRFWLKLSRRYVANVEPAIRAA